MSLAITPDVARLMRLSPRLMTSDRLAALQPSRVSASRALMSRAIRQRWSIVRERTKRGRLTRVGVAALLPRLSADEAAAGAGATNVLPGMLST